MIQGGFFGFLYQMAEWITRIVYVSVLWLLFSIAGLVVFGLSPATVAMYTVTRKWAMGNTEVPVFRTFWQAYRSEFIKANLLLLPLAVLAYAIYLDYQYLKLLDGPIFYLMLFAMINASIIFALVALYIFPLYVHLNCKPFQYYKYALLVSISNPLLTLLMIISCFVVFKLITLAPGLPPLLPAGLLSFVIMRLAYSAFLKLEAEQKSGGIKKTNISL